MTMTPEERCYRRSERLRELATSVNPRPLDDDGKEACLAAADLFLARGHALTKQRRSKQTA